MPVSCKLPAIPFHLVCAAGTLLMAGAGLCAEGPEDIDIGTYMQGRHVFESQCAPCHGQRGRGDGEWAKGVPDMPRNFRMGIFKFRTTPMGFLPTHADLVRTVRSGVSGTMMPAFTQMADADVQAVIAYLKQFSKRWDDAKNYTTPVPIPDTPEWFQSHQERSAHAAKGASIFQQTCAACHGTAGKGDGPGAKGLMDVWGHAIVPADLSKPHHKSGGRPADLFRTISLGLDGTPMAGFRGVLQPEQIWDLVAYIGHLGEKAGAKKVTAASAGSPASAAAR